ncbi:hypothetical protein [Kutzneria sp. CA-103260]|uniref:hypothetical protein n=1 Tax=Kutzneria sp. CA-103260 TaxID=2802641 RepID=UPI001BA5B9C5|nr:hypothetical protein [Kutzneria sp. CA-103260]QUQ71395.1 hypothetical protein JJ691_91800 [Kutzneria sp. CA-103260]
MAVRDAALACRRDLPVQLSTDIECHPSGVDGRVEVNDPCRHKEFGYAGDRRTDRDTIAQMVDTNAADVSSDGLPRAGRLPLATRPHTGADDHGSLTPVRLTGKERPHDRGRLAVDPAGVTAAVRPDRTRARRPEYAVTLPA